MSGRLAARLAEARGRLFGEVQGNGMRSGRKVLRAALKGPQVAAYYPYTLKELEAPYYEDPAIEDLYRAESELNRVGKTRVEGKLRPIRAGVAERIALADYNMEKVNWNHVKDPKVKEAGEEHPMERGPRRQPELIALNTKET